jgi:ferredoxin
MGATLEDVTLLLSGTGLASRGGFNFDSANAAPELPGRLRAQSVVLIGHGGGDFWSVFKGWLEEQETTSSDPLDTWSRKVIDHVAETCRASAVYPSDIPYLPFQRWATRAEGLKASPLGILMHPEFGLWHAYRGALLFDRVFDFSAVDRVIHICDGCDEKPCLNSCPVNAISTNGFAVRDCRAHVSSEEGLDCRSGGCLARNVCPYGARYQYSPDQQAFHMAAFLRGRI